MVCFTAEGEDGKWVCEKKTPREGKKENAKTENEARPKFRTVHCGRCRGGGGEKQAMTMTKALSGRWKSVSSL